jgi:glucokinase
VAHRNGAVLGLDIGGTKLAAGVVDSSGGVRSFVVAPTPAGDPEAGLERLWELGRRAVAAARVPWDQIGGVGIGCGGPLDPERGIVVAPPHLPGWRNLPVAAMALEAYHRPAALDNDATAAAAGEHRFGAGMGTRNMVYLTISTGIGGGVVIDDRLYHGAAGNGGELGHVTIDWRGRHCRSCGRRGCLEAYASGTSIAERAREAIERGELETALAPDAGAAEIVAAAAAGDTLARAVWDETIEALACGLTSIVNLFEPEVVVLGGGVTKAGAALLDPVRERVRADAMGPAGEAARIVLSPLGERVGVVGAAAVAYERAA